MIYQEIDWENETVYVTGGAGMIGSHLIEQMVLKGVNEVYVYDDFSRGQKSNLENVAHYIKFSKIDLARDVPYFAPSSIIFHLAAHVTGIHYNAAHQLEMLQTNLAINHNVVEGIRRSKAPAKLFQYTSTACVYPHDAPVPTPESAALVCDPEPTNHGYGVAKWVGEQQARRLHEELGIPTIVTRFFNAIGPRDYYDEETSHVAPAIIKRVHESQNPLTIWGTGDQTRVLVDARDIVGILLRLADQPLAHNASPINVGHNHMVSISNLAEMIMGLYGSQSEIICDTSKPNGYEQRAADPTYLESLIGRTSFTPLIASLRDMIIDYAERVGDLEKANVA